VRESDAEKIGDVLFHEYSQNHYNKFIILG